MEVIVKLLALAILAQFGLFANAVPVPAYYGNAAAKVAVTSATPSSSGASWTTLPFTTADQVFDRGGFIGTNIFTAPEDGIYTIQMYAYYSNSGAAQTAVGLGYKVNGGAVRGLDYRSMDAGDVQTFNGSQLVELSTGDTVTFLMLDTNNIQFQNIEASMVRH